MDALLSAIEVGLEDDGQKRPLSNDEDKEDRDSSDEADREAAAMFDRT